MNEAFTAEVRSIRAIHDRLENRITTLERQAGEHTRPACRDRLPADRIDLTRAKREHFLPPENAAPAPLRPKVEVPPLPPAVEEPKPTPPPAPPKSSSTPAGSNSDVELQIGRVWLVRIGIVVLLTGLVFLGNFAYHEFIPRLGPAGKLALLVLAAGALAGIGHFVRRRASLANYGRVLTGGALATAYYAAYAAHFVEPLRVITNSLLGGTLLLACGGAILWLADRLRSQTIAAVTIALAFYTAAINPLTEFSLFSNLVLAKVGVVLLLRHRWTTVTFLSLVGTYGAFAFWRLVNTGTISDFDAPSETLFWTAIAFPACYWVVFTTAVILGRDRVFPKDQLTTFLTFNNAAFYGLIAPVIAGTHPDALGWSTLVFGAALIGLSRLNASTSGTYLTQGLGLVFAGVLLEFTGYQRALIFAFQSALLLKLSLGRHGRIYQIFSALAAVLATGLATESLVAGVHHAALVAIAVATILGSCAFLFKLQRNVLAPLSLQYRAAAFVSLATFLTGAVIFQTTTGDARLAWFLAFGLAAPFAVRLTRLPELALIGQTFVILGGALWFQAAPTDLLPLSFVLISGLALVHWWQRQRALPASAETSLTGQALHTILPLAALAKWMINLSPESPFPILFAVLALILLVYGFATRAWTIAAGSALFTLAATALTAHAIVFRDSWLETTLATALIFSQSLVIAALAARAPARSATPLLHARRFLRAITFVLASGIVLVFTPGQWHFLIFTASGLAFLTAATRVPGREIIHQAAALAAVGLAVFGARLLTGHPAFLPDAFGFPLLLAAQQIGKRQPLPDFTSPIQAALSLVAIAGLWLTVGRLVATFADGILITASWSLLATAILALGFALRERTYRHAGLGILLAAIGRLVLFDVWQFDTLTRILSFVVLGTVLLLIGFFYNRFAETLRRWM